MGSGEAETPAKTPKSSDREQPQGTTSSSAAAVYPDWSSFQAYSPFPPHGFFPSPMASTPQAHPYMWGAQHIMPPYGTPPPPYVMYPPGGVYAHPSMPPGAHPFSPYAMPPNGAADTSGATPGGSEADGKNNNEPGKTSGTSANGVFSQSGESESESSSEGSDANSQNDSNPKSSAGQEDENPQRGDAARGSQNGRTRTPAQGMSNQIIPVMPVQAAGVLTGPTTNLNIGMDYWSAQGATPIPVIHGKVPSTAVGGPVVATDQWMQDERELKRQRRKQSNRESARRSRLRKQAECEELAQRADSLKAENASLREELDRVRKEYDELRAQNSSLKEKLGDIQPKTDDPRPDMNARNSFDNYKKHSDSDSRSDKANQA